MSPLTFASFYLLMFLVASFFSVLGLGGGVLYTPVQLFFGVEFHEAASTSLFLTIVMSLSATLVFHRAAVVDWPLAIVLETSTTLGAFLGGLFSGYFSGRFLICLFSGTLAVAAFFMVQRFDVRKSYGGRHTGFFRWHRNVCSDVYCVNLGLALPLSLVAGAVSGLIGVSDGILKVPMLVLLFGVPMNIAVASSAFMAGLTASSGFLGHLAAGSVDWKMALILTLGIFMGAQIGARKSVKVDTKRLKQLFGYVLAALAVFLLVQIVLQ